MNLTSTQDRRTRTVSAEDILEALRNPSLLLKDPVFGETTNHRGDKILWFMDSEEQLGFAEVRDNTVYLQMTIAI